MAKIKIAELRTALERIHDKSSSLYNGMKGSSNPQTREEATKQQAIASLSYDILQALDGNKMHLSMRQ